VQNLKSEQGQTMVEFALVLPIFLVLMIGIFDFGSAFNSKNDLNFLANTAARFAEVNQCVPCTPGPNAIKNYVKSTADTSQLSGALDITFQLPSGTSKVGDPLQVTVCAPTSFFLNARLPGLPTADVTLRSIVTVRIAQLPDPSVGSLYTTSAPC
jgi:Flp pilus assembly pilin Flp